MPFDRIVAVDWGKALRMRCAWVADGARRTVRPLDGGPWHLSNVLRRSRELSGRVLVGIDASLGIPQAYFDAGVRAVPGWRKARDFLSWLPVAVATPGFLDEVRSAEDWRHDRPFIAVPKGKGALTAFWMSAGGKLAREVEARTGAKSTFVVSGIPGTVGSGTRELWRELVPLLARDRAFGVWPYEGTLVALSRRHPVVLAEIYPRVCYALALDEVLPAPLRTIAKVKAEPRARAVAALLATPWMSRCEVVVAPEHAELAVSNEDDFDAMISAASLLRCVIEGRSLERVGSFPVEGDLLGIGLLDLSRRPNGEARPARRPRRPASVRRASRQHRRHRCPIDGCAKVFVDSRGGWDAHVGALRLHPKWRPDEPDPGMRRKLFRSEYSTWFDGVGSEE